MNINFNPAYMKILRNLLITILVAKAISLGMLWYFPSEGVNYHASSSKAPEYKRYSVNNIIKAAQRPDLESGSQELGELTAYGPNISNMVLSGLFKSKSGGYVIIALKAKPDNAEVLGIGESFEGYTLKKILENGALFDKGGQSYSLYFSEDKQGERYTQRAGAPESDEETMKQVAKSDISYYAKNVDQIWKDIGIVEEKKNGKITGFKVTRIKANTPFANLGLRQGDIIIKANNKPMTSYKDALAIYQGIDKLQALELIVLRNNQETEIVYEIY
ncbi:PDZ domain-containing protein [Sulfurimonas sp. HSL3-7]|uniref:PDZ domain-containing protein n=1 Tax=Sulfonitrofixus jiaomeiensis TaxID=3131938 RepID=UPI0031FA32C1